MLEYLTEHAFDTAIAYLVGIVVYYLFTAWWSEESWNPFKWSAFEKFGLFIVPVFGIVFSYALDYFCN